MGARTPGRASGRARPDRDEGCLGFLLRDFWRRSALGGAGISRRLRAFPAPQGEESSDGAKDEADER